MKPRLNLLIIQQAPDWGGAEAWMASLVGEWVRKKITITAYTNLPKLKRSFCQSGAKTYHLPFILDINGNLKGLIKSTLLLPFAIYFYSKALFKAKQTGVNLILMSGFSEKLLVTWLAYFFNLPVVWFEYGPLTPIFKRNFCLPQIIYSLTKHLPSKVMTISRFTYQNLNTQARISPSKLKLIYPGVTIPAQNTFCSKLTVGHLSRLTPEKGQRDLIIAWKKVAIQYPTAQLLIAGSGPDKQFLKKLAAKLGLKQSIKFLGFTNKDKFYRSCSIFIFPSKWDMEGFGLVIPEAMSYALPVIAYQNGPAPEVINRQSGILVPTGNIQTLSNSIIKLLQNKQQRLQLGQAAKSRAQKFFNLTHQAQQIYQQLINVLAQDINK